MRLFVVCTGIQDQIIGLTTDSSWRNDIWNHTGDSRSNLLLTIYFDEISKDNVLMTH